MEPSSCARSARARATCESKPLPHDDAGEHASRTVDFFRAAEARLGKLAAIGIASFGPVDLDPLRDLRLHHLDAEARLGQRGHRGRNRDPRSKCRSASIPT